MRQNLHAAEEEEERASLVMLEACGRALVVLARSINTELEHGQGLSAPETVEIRELAIDLMTDAVEILAAHSLVESDSGGVDRVNRHHLLVRLLCALDRIVETSASARDFSASIQSAANLIRSTCQEEDRPQRVRHAVRRPTVGLISPRSRIAPPTSTEIPVAAFTHWRAKFPPFS